MALCGGVLLSFFVPMPLLVAVVVMSDRLRADLLPKVVLMILLMVCRGALRHIAFKTPAKVKAVVGVNLRIVASA